jgi:hypothetical protein
MFCWIVLFVCVVCLVGLFLFVSQVIKLFGRQNRETEEILREREREREKNKIEQDCELDFNLSFFLALHSCAKLVAKEKLGMERL